MLTESAVVSLDESQSEELRTGQITRIKIFQLTEWIYRFLTTASFPSSPISTISGDQVMTLYRNCLDWYENFLALSEVQSNNSVSVLFVQ